MLAALRWILLLTTIGALGCQERRQFKQLQTLAEQLSFSGKDAGLARTNIQIDFSGTLLLSSPYALGSSTLEQLQDTNVARQVLERGGVSEEFLLTLVSTNGRVHMLPLRKPAVFFNKLFVIRCQSGDILKFEVRNSTLVGLSVTGKE